MGIQSRKSYFQHVRRRVACWLTRATSCLFHSRVGGAAALFPMASFKPQGTPALFSWPDLAGECWKDWCSFYQGSKPEGTSHRSCRGTTDLQTPEPRDHGWRQTLEHPSSRRQAGVTLSNKVRHFLKSRVYRRIWKPTQTGTSKLHAQKGHENNIHFYLEPIPSFKTYLAK